ncbi:MAG: leucine-rich repeat protein [Oscillospiraceae bacterium]|jgi:hypothetical protein|nr:leucine-rich repeat protein [Oscillospiraceae bacterium]
MLKTKKRMFACIFALVLIIAVIPFADFIKNINAPDTSAADANYSDGTAEFTVNPKNSSEIQSITLLVSSDGVPSAEVVLSIPEEINGVPITSLGNVTFTKCGDVTELNLPASITNITSKAFLPLANLVSFNVDENNATFISENGILYSKDKTALVSFPQNKADTSFSIENVDSFSSYSFYGNRNIQKLSIENRCSTIESNAFSNMQALTDITLTKDLTSISSSAFDGSNLISTVLISGIPSDRKKAVTYGTFGSKSTATVICSLNADGTANTLLYFPPASNSTNYTIPKNIKKIGERAFANAPNLQQVTFNDTTTVISDYAFQGSGLTSFTAPSTLSSIGMSAFDSCPNLTTVDMSLAGSKKTSLSVGVQAFSNCPSLTSCTFSDFTNTIMMSTFQGDTALTDVSLPQGLTSIGSGAFAGCTSLQQVLLPAKLKTIGYTAFASTSVTSFYLGSNIELNGIDLFSAGIITTEPITIVGYSKVNGKDSAAKLYAEENGMNFQDLGDFVAKKADLDGDGTISKDELNAVCQAILNQQVVDNFWLSVEAQNSNLTGSDVSQAKRDLLAQLKKAQENTEITEDTETETTEDTENIEDVD